jgi:uncharacterized protein
MPVVLEPAASPYLKPLPQQTERNEEFLTGLAERRFLVPKCQDCGDYNWPPYPACRTCLSESLRWTHVSGAGTLFSFTVVHRGPGAFGAEVPYVIALGELAEQPRPCLVLANLVDIAPDDVRVGMAIEIAFQDIPDENITMWRWVPRAE